MTAAGVHFLDGRELHECPGLTNGNGDDQANDAPRSLSGAVASAHMKLSPNRRYNDKSELKSMVKRVNDPLFRKE